MNRYPRLSNPFARTLAATCLVAVAACSDGGQRDQQPTEPQPTAASTDGYVSLCEDGLCIDNTPFRFHSATTYGQLDDAAAEVRLAKEAGLNSLEIVEYEKDYRNLDDTMSEATWSRVDNLVAEAGRQDLRIILNLSSYGHSLKEAGQKPVTADWSDFLRFVADRTNSQTGVRYSDDPTIAMVQLYGEVDAPNYSEPTRGTKQEVTDFYRRTLAQARELFPRHILSTGGFSYLDDPNSGIDWRTIMADKNNDVCSVEINAVGDRTVSMPNVAAHCAKLGKPWFLAAWSACYRPEGKHFDGDVNSYRDETSMAAHAQDMYNVSNNTKPIPPAPAQKAVGTSFWNLGTKGACDIGPQFPKILEVVQRNAPAS